MRLPWTLICTGRDMPEQSLAVDFDTQQGGWRILGDAHERASTAERQQALDCLRDAGMPLKPAEVAKAIGVKPNSAGYRLRQLVAEGLAFIPSYGLFAAVEQPVTVSGTPHSAHSPHTSAVGLGPEAVSTPHSAPHSAHSPHTSVGTESGTVSAPHGTTHTSGRDNGVETPPHGVAAGSVRALDGVSAAPEPFDDSPGGLDLF